MRKTIASILRLAMAVAAAGTIVLLLSALIFAQEQKPAPEPDYKIVDVKCDHGKLPLEDKKPTVLTGNVVITQGDTVLRSDKVVYEGDKQVATSPGPLTVTDPDNDIRGDFGVVYLKQRKGILQGNIKLVAKPRQKPQSDPKAKEWNDKATITCDSIEYLYKLKQATASGNLKIVQKDRTVTADKAVYLVKDELVTLTGNVKGHDEKNQTVSAGGKVVVSTKEGDEWMEIEQATGSFRVKSEEEEPQPAEAPARPAKQ